MGRFARFRKRDLPVEVKKEREERISRPQTIVDPVPK